MYLSEKVLGGGAWIVEGALVVFGTTTLRTKFKLIIVLVVVRLYPLSPMWTKKAITACRFEDFNHVPVSSRKLIAASERRSSNINVVIRPTQPPSIH